MRQRKFPDRGPQRRPYDLPVEALPVDARRRPTKSGTAPKWKDEWLPIVVGLYGRGWTNTEIARLLEIKPSLLHKWRQLRPELKAEMDKVQSAWRAHADDRVVRALYERAIGYSYENEDGRIVHMPPDTKAIETWLFNRRGGEWRSKQEVVYSSGDDPRMLTDEELLQIIHQGAPKQLEGTLAAPRKSGNGTTH